MSRAIEDYLDRVLVYANRPPEESRQIREELRDHLAEKAEALEAEGLSEADAIHEAIKRHGNPRTVGYGLRPKFPWVDIRSSGTARGVIAIGPRAVGVFAFGGAAMGVFAFGGVACGVVGMGGLAAMLLFAWAGIGVVPLGFGFLGIGAAAVAVGGMVCGLVSVGGMAAGLWVPISGPSISYFTKETVPDILMTIDSVIMTNWFVPNLILGLAATFFPALIVSNLMQWRENRRVAEAEGWIAE